MESHEALKLAVGTDAVKMAKRLGRSSSLVHKWCEPSTDFSDSGALNPLDRLLPGAPFRRAFPSAGQTSNQNPGIQQARWADAERRSLPDQVLFILENIVAERERDCAAG